MRRLASRATQAGPAQRTRRPAEVDPPVDAAAVEGVRAHAEPPHLVRRFQPLQAHDARRRRGLAVGRRMLPAARVRRALMLLGQELRVLNLRQPLLDVLGQRGVRGGGRFVGREAAEPHYGEHEQHGVPDGAEEPAEGDERLRDGEAVAHQREPHMIGGSVDGWTTQPGRRKQREEAIAHLSHGRTGEETRRAEDMGDKSGRGASLRRVVK
jgi:hypothetical protein